MKRKPERNIRPMRARVWRSYFVIGLLSLLCGVAVFGTANQIISRQTRDAYTDVLKAASSMLDGKIALIQNAANELSASTDITTALGASETRPANRQAVINQRAYQALAEYCERTDGLISVSLYKISDEKVIASECCTQANTYFDMRYTGLGLTFEGWKDMMRGQYAGLTETVIEVPGGQNLVWYLRSLPLAGWGTDASPQATLVLEIDENFFALYYDKLGLENELIMEVVSQTGAQFWGAGQAQSDVKGMSALTLESEKTGWSYRLYVPNHLLTRQIRSLMWISLIVFCALETANLLLIPRFVEKYYGPVSQMVGNISQSLGVKINDADIAFVQTQFDRLIREQSHTLATVESLKNSMRQVELIHLLLGNTNPDNLRGAESGDFDTKAFMVCVVAGKGNDTLGEADVDALAKPIVGEDGFLDGECVRFNGCAVFLIDCTSMNEEDLEINIGLMRERLDEKRFLLAVSQAYVGRENIAVAYREAKWHAQYAALPDWEKTDTSDFRLDSQSLEDIARLINCLAARDEVAARDTLAALLRHNRPKCLGNPVLAHVLISVLMSDLLKNCNPYFPGWESDVVSTWNLSLAIDDYTQLERELADLSARICRRPQNGETTREGLKREILSYIEEHYSDFDISMESIADAFGKSVATITRAFREDGADSSVMGEIAKRRIAAACNLLSEEKDMTIAAVSHKAGYSSMATFMRHFKQLTGVSPGRYRELSRKT